MRKILIATVFALLISAVSFSKEPSSVTIIPDDSFRPIELKTPPPTVPNNISLQTPRVLVLPTPKPTPKPTKKPVIATGSWIYDREVSWYGPRFYGNRTACGQAYTTTIMGVAHRTLPCGTLVEFRWNGKTATVPVIDRGPYVKGRTWDLSGALCVYLDHCFTGPIEYRLVK